MPMSFIAVDDFVSGISSGGGGDVGGGGGGGSGGGGGGGGGGGSSGMDGDGGGGAYGGHADEDEPPRQRVRRTMKKPVGSASVPKKTAEVPKGEGFFLFLRFNRKCVRT